MLDNEPTGTPSNEASSAAQSHSESSDLQATAGAVTPAAKPRRRAASRPAGPPAGSAPEPAAAAASQPAAEPEATAAPAPRKRTRKKTVATPPAEAASDTPATGEPQAADAPAAEAPAPRKRTRKKAVATPPADATPVEPASDPTPAGGVTTDQSAAAPTAASSAPAAESDGDGTPAPRKRRRAASAPAGPPRVAAAETKADVEVEADDGTGGAQGSARPARVVPPTLIFQPPEVNWEQANRQQAQRAATAEKPAAPAAEASADEHDAEQAAQEPRAKRRRTRNRNGKAEAEQQDGKDTPSDKTDRAEKTDRADRADRSDKNAQRGADHGQQHDDEGDDDDEGGSTSSRRRRRRRRRASAAEAVAEIVEPGPDDPPNTVVKVRAPRSSRSGRQAESGDGVQSVKGSTRLEAKKQRRREGREQGRRRPPIITEAEFLARRESVERVMVVRQRGSRTQIGVLEDGVLVEHYVNRETSTSYVGNMYLGKVQNVLPSMEAAFVDIGKGRNAVLYAGEVNFDALGLDGGVPKRIESVLKAGQSVLVQVTKDPIGHKGARLTSQVSLPGRYLVYVPEGSMTGISRKLPDTERARLKQILKQVVPEDAGVIVRTAAEGASADELGRDVERLAAQWTEIQRRAQTASAPSLLYGEPDLTVRVIRDIFNEDFNKLIVSGDEAYQTVYDYVHSVAPDLEPRLEHWTSDVDLFSVYRVDEQLAKALDRKVWLPSGGSLVIDRTEAMIVIDVNTGKFTGQGGNLEETVTRNNLEAAEEIVRQLRLRDLGGIVVIDFIDMVLESNRELVLRRLVECLGRDRTKHQVAEVTSLGLVQMTRKRVGQGLLEAFSEQCERCSGRGVIVRTDLLESPKNGRKPHDHGHEPVHVHEPVHEPVYEHEQRREAEAAHPAAEAVETPADEAAATGAPATESAQETGTSGRHRRRRMHRGGHGGQHDQNDASAAAEHGDRADHANHPEHGEHTEHAVHAEQGHEPAAVVVEPVNGTAKGVDGKAAGRTARRRRTTRHASGDSAGGTNGTSVTEPAGSASLTTPASAP